MTLTRGESLIPHRCTSRRACQLVAALCLLAWQLLAQAAQLPLTLYDQGSGLTSLSVVRIYQDREGFVWVGTEKGLYRFDGMAFSQVGAEQGFQVSEVISFDEDVRGRLWVGSRAGLQLRENGRFGWVRPEGKPLLADRGQTLAADDAGGMWLVSANRLLLLSPDGASHWNVTAPFSEAQRQAFAGLDKVSAVFHANGSTWFGCGDELCSLRGGQLRRYGADAGVPADKWLGFLAARDGSLWVRGIHTVRMLAPGSDQFVARDMPGNSADVAASSIDIAQDHEGRVLTRSSTGLARWDGQRWELFGTDDGLPKVGVSALSVDQDGTLWIGTYGRGLLHWSGRDAVENWTSAQGLSGSLIWSISRAPSGAVWVADDWGGSVIGAGQDHAEPWPLAVAPPHQTRTVLSAADGSVWYFLFDGRVLRYEPGSRKTTVVATLPFLVRGAFQDSHGRFWAYTLGGLYALDGATGRMERAAPDLIPTSMCSDLAEDRAGRLWAACRAGLFRFAGGRWTHVRVAPEEALGGYENVAVTPDGRLWLSSLQPGLLGGAAGDADSVTLTPVDDPLLADSRVYFLRADRRGRLWVGGNNGVDVLNAQRWTRLTSRDGLLWDETNHGAFHADEDGSVWVGTPIGLSHLLKPEELLAPRELHPWLVSAFYNGHELAGKQAEADFGVGGALVLRFAVLGNSSGSPVRFRYRLSDIDNDWVEASTREVRYAALPPGTYRFELQAVDENQRRLSAPISLGFTLNPPWWRSTPAFAAAALLLLAAFALAWRWRVRVLVKHAQRLEQAVAVRTEQLQSAMRARGMLLARISHDLRSPLAGIIESVRQWRQGSRRRDYPALIEGSARQQLDLIDELLEFSRDELTDLELVEAPGYLHAFLQSVAEQAALPAERRGNRFVTRYAEDLPALVRLDFRRLRQVLANLIGNAAKFTDDGYIQLTVTAAPSVPGRVQLQVAVEDSGIGIEPSERERLAQPFARGGNAAHYDGYGLGLAIVTQLLGRMGSRLNIDAAPGGGSRFGFVLDVALAEEAELDQELSAEGGGEIDGAGRRILVVDDHPQSRDMLCDLLDGFGFESVPAESGEEALSALQKQAIDLVVTDQFMPGMDGWALLRALRSEYAAVPVLLYSSLPPRRAEDGLAFDDALLKPASGKQLLEHVDRLLSGVNSET
ncbi:two-component regulator propeller domain-containing protein [Dyella sp. SG609]|uniref:two-component regulator propeller domain-containing protein n=1 Tax=Dyella sp. SG609 TaxID=2587018 RepID=UPI001448135D|nr:signal transduction histidine kinase/ligand-binding sensor domain-containing protein [Dyella sp. SG609]